MRGERLEEAIGVTRVARVTGLDRAGVEVACAIRPGGHVLQVSNGKGETWAQAKASALSEAAELFCAERPEAAELRWASLRELRELGEAALSPRDLPLAAPALWSDDLRIAWAVAEDLLGGGSVLVPAQAVFCPPQGSSPLGPAACRWSSNGMGAHPRKDAAVLHALFEACERDQLARALPEGFTPQQLRRRLLDRRGLSPRTAARVSDLESRGFDVFLFDLAPGGPRDLGLAVAGAMLADREGGPVPLTAGYACRASADEALLSALLEAAQTRITDVHGAREDVSPPDREGAAALAQHCRRIVPTRAVKGMAEGRASVTSVLERLRRAGHGRVACVQLGRDAIPLHVAKVLAAGLLVSELL